MYVNVELVVWQEKESSPASLIGHDPLKIVRIAGSLFRTGEYYRVIVRQEQKACGVRVWATHVDFCQDGVGMISAEKSVR